MNEERKKAAQKAIERIKVQSDLVAVIPAGGLGGEMYPVTSGMPKALLPLNDKPLLVKILQELDCSVFTKVVVVANEWYKMIESYLKAFESQIKVQCECKKTSKPPPQYLKELLSSDELSDPFLLHYCDIWIRDIDWERVVDEYKYIKRKRAIVALLLASRCYDYSVGVMSLDRYHRVTDFRQKPEDIMHGYANCAVALLSTTFIQDYINADESDIYDEGGALHKARRDNKVFGLEVGDWHHIQQIRDWLKAQKEYYEHVPFRPR